MDVLRGHVFEVCFIDFRAEVHVMGHTGRGGDVVHLPVGVRPQVKVGGGLAREPVPRGLCPSFGVHLAQSLHHLEKACPSADAVLLQRGRHGQADGLFRAAPVGHHQVGGQRVQSALHALHGGVKRLQIDGNIGPLPRDVDGLLSSHPSFMLGPWIENARAWGTTPAEKDYFEQQARTILTIWGGPVLNDYANRMWGGLVKDYYAKRWDMFFRKVLQCARQGKSFDEKAFNEELSAFEQDWTRRHTHYAVSPRKNTLGEALKIYDRYMREFYGEVR